MRRSARRRHDGIAGAARARRGLSDIASVSAGAVHSLATGGSGVIWAWGGNQASQLGDGTTTNRRTPSRSASRGDGRVGGWRPQSRDRDRHLRLGVGQQLPRPARRRRDRPEKTPVPMSGPDLAWGVALPVFTPAAGAYSEPISVFIATPTPGATIRFTTNGNDPTASDPVLAPGDSVTIGSPTTVKARGFKTGMAPSATATAVYTFELARSTRRWPRRRRARIRRRRASR